MKAPRQWQVTVALEAHDGKRILRTVDITAVHRSDAVHRATVVAPAPGQRVVGIERAR